MGWVLMSEREVHRVEVLSGVLAGRMSTSEAASVLCLSDRQVQRLLKTFREDGAVALRHKARGRPSNNRTLEGLRDLTLALVRERYADFGPTLAAEKLAERDGVKVSRETLRKWMVEDGLWLSRSQRRVFHRPPLRAATNTSVAIRWVCRNFSGGLSASMAGVAVRRTSCRAKASRSTQAPAKS